MNNHLAPVQNVIQQRQKKNTPASVILAINEARRAQARGANANEMKILRDKFDTEMNKQYITLKERHLKELQTASEKLAESERKVIELSSTAEKEEMLFDEMAKGENADMDKIAFLAGLLGIDKDVIIDRMSTEAQRDARAGIPEEVQRYREGKREGVYDPKGGTRDKSRIYSQLDPNYTESPASAMDKLQMAEEDFGVPREDTREGLRRQINPPEEDTRTDEEKVFDAFYQAYRDGKITEEQFNKFMEGYMGYRDPSISASKLPESGKIREIVEQYEAFTPNRELIDNLYVMAPKTQGEKLVTSINAMLQGRTYEEMSEEDREKTAKQAARYAIRVKGGGEIEQREKFARLIMRQSLPNVVQKYNKVRGKLGRLTQGAEGVFKFVGGTTSDPDVAIFQATMIELTNAYVALRSGAAVTDREYQRYKDNLPGIDKEEAFNDALLISMIDSLDSYFNSMYKDNMGDTWGQLASDVTMGHWRKQVQMLEPGEKDSQMETPKATEGRIAEVKKQITELINSGWTDEEIRESLKDAGYTDEEIESFYR